MNYTQTKDFIVGVAELTASLTPLVGAAYFAARRMLKKSIKEITESNTHATQMRVKEALMSIVEPLAPDSYFTLKLCFAGGFCISVPMIRNRAVTLGENICMGIITTNPKETILSLVCDGFGYLKDHYHPDACETIFVQAGSMTCTRTGHIYHAGDTWSIEPNESHGASFHDFVGIVTHRPPLKRACDQPVDLDSMSEIFP